MAKNAPKGPGRRGAVKGRSQFIGPGGHPVKDATGLRIALEGWPPGHELGTAFGRAAPSRTLPGHSSP